MMRFSALIGLTGSLTIFAAVASPAFGYGAAHVRERFGNIEYVAGDGTVRQLSTGGGFSEPVLSPDGHLAAFVHINSVAVDEGEQSAPTSLWIANTNTGKSEKLIDSQHSENPESNFWGFGHPTFSLDGRFIYVTGALAVVSPAVHQVSVQSRSQRFVTRGGLSAVIRSGPYRGYLLVGEHRYFDAPKVGSFNAVYVVRPDGKEMFQVPGSDADDATDHVAAWLKSKTWQAW